MDSPQYKERVKELVDCYRVLNLIINGQSSILGCILAYKIANLCFKPYYKWIVLNT